MPLESEGILRFRAGRKLVVDMGMPRRPRLLVPDAIYHVMSRGNRKGPIFQDNEDRRRFLSILETTVARYGVRCYAQCLMDTHYHLAIDTPRANLSAALGYLNGVYTQTSNRRHSWTGHVFEGRFNSIVVGDQSYLRRLCRYIALNPVVARKVQDPAAWPWSSYAATAELCEPPAYLYLDWLGPVFGTTSHSEAQRRYRLYINDDTQSDSLDDRAVFVGDSSLESKARGALAGRFEIQPLPRAYRALARPTLDQLFAGANRLRTRRGAVIERAHVEFGYRLAEIAYFLKIHPSTASLILRQREGEQQSAK